MIPIKAEAYKRPGFNARGSRHSGYLKRRPQERTLSLRDGQRCDRSERLKACLKLIPIDLALRRIVAVGGRDIHEVQKVRVGIAILFRLRREVLEVRQAYQPGQPDCPAGLLQ